MTAVYELTQAPPPPTAAFSEPAGHRRLIQQVITEQDCVTRDIIRAAEECESSRTLSGQCKGKSLRCCWGTLRLITHGCGAGLSLANCAVLGLASIITCVGCGCSKTGRKMAEGVGIAALDSLNTCFIAVTSVFKRVVSPLSLCTDCCCKEKTRKLEKNVYRAFARSLKHLKHTPYSDLGKEIRNDIEKNCYMTGVRWASGASECANTTAIMMQSGPMSLDQINGKAMMTVAIRQAAQKKEADEALRLAALENPDQEAAAPQQQAEVQLEILQLTV